MDGWVRVAQVAAAAVIAGTAVAAAAPRDHTLSRIASGLWEVSGAQGARETLRECFADPGVLAQFEHRAKRCSRKVLSDTGTSALLDYQCSSRDFGRSKLTFLTPRSLRIETQGISDGLPFNYVLQARRMGECSAKASPQSH
jgi:hypothetical protein